MSLDDRPNSRPDPDALADAPPITEPAPVVQAADPTPARRSRLRTHHTVALTRKTTNASTPHGSRNPSWSNVGSVQRAAAMPEQIVHMIAKISPSVRSMPSV